MPRSMSALGRSIDPACGQSQHAVSWPSVNPSKQHRIHQHPRLDPQRASLAPGAQPDRAPVKSPEPPAPRPTTMLSKPA